MSRAGAAALFAVTIVLALPTTTLAALDWRPPEPLPAGVSSGAVGPDSTALLFGFPDPAQMNRQRVVVRPVGGPVGPPQDYTPLATSADVPVVAFDAAGNALAGSPGSLGLAYRPAGAASVFGTRQSLSGFGGVLDISMAPSGEALVGTDQGSATNGKTRVAFRPAGPGALLDLANLQEFAPPPGGSMRLIGLQLDPDGAAVVVMMSGLNTYQAVRLAGQASFQAPEEIQAPGLRPDEYQLNFSSDPNGHAVLAYSSGVAAVDGPTKLTRAVAAYRPPGGAFATPTVLGVATVSQGDVLELSQVQGAVTANGDGLIAWNQRVPVAFSCPGGVGDSGNSGAYAARLHGGVFDPGAPIAPSVFPESSGHAGVAGGGDRVVVGLTSLHRGSGDECDVRDNSSDIAVRTYVSAAGGLEPEGDQLVGASGPSGLPAGQSQFRHPNFRAPGILVGAAGTTLVGAATAAGGSLSPFLHVREDLVATPTLTPVPIPTLAPGAGSSGPSIKPLVPKNLVVPAPITASRPVVTVICPPDVGRECRFRFAIYAAFGALPGQAGAAKKKRNAVLLARATATLKPGTRKTIKLKLSKAGRKAVRAKRRAKARLVITVTADGRTRTSTLSVKIGGR